MKKRTLHASLLAVGAAFLLAACGSSEPDPRRGPQPKPVPAAPTFDPGSVPLSSAEWPAFPYLTWPESVRPADRRVARKADLEAYTVIAGETLRNIEGRLEQHQFKIPEGRSTLQIRREYAHQFAVLGAVQVNDLQPTTDGATTNPVVQKMAGEGVDVPAKLDLQHYDEGQYQYAVFLGRTPTSLIWFVLQSSQYTVVVTTIEESLAPAG